jgi:hypothetical protein
MEKPMETNDVPKQYLDEILRAAEMAYDRRASLVDRLDAVDRLLDAATVLERLTDFYCMGEGAPEIAIIAAGRARVDSDLESHE